jgi:hypothetical protein
MRRGPRLDVAGGSERTASAITRRRIARPLALLALCAASVFFARTARAADPLVVADRDDDDGDGIPDGEQSDRVPSSSELVRVALDGVPIAERRVGPSRGPAALRVLADGKPVAPGERIPARVKRLEIQARGVGAGEVELGGRVVRARAIAVYAVDGEGGLVDLTRSHASLERTPPDRLPDDPLSPTHDPDALRFVVAGAALDVPTTISLLSMSAAGEVIDGLSDVPLFQTSCPPGLSAGVVCGSTRPIRAAVDEIDRSHPVVADRSVKADLGGALVVASPEHEKLQMIRVGGPRKTPAGPIVRYRAHLRVMMVRPSPHGPPPMGGDEAGALAVARGEVRRASALWGECGIGFGPDAELDVRVVDPPRPHLLALGCDQGLPASGGAIHARIDGKDLSVELSPGMRPSSAARAVASAVRAAGFVVRVSDNPVIGGGAFGSSDVLVRRRDGALAAFELPASGPISTDATMTACIGQVDLSDGLQHFGDIDAIAGTVEERALVKAFDDGDPTTIDVVMVPTFAGGGRIGESFISADSGAVRNVILEDRAGVRAERSSFALAHELGHVLLDDPGHPDDFGTDTPTRLMDADAANSSAYGPRRLTIDECARAVRQSGPDAPVPLLSKWPLGPIMARK